MSRKATTHTNDYKQEKLDPPKTLDNHPFYGLKLDKEQTEFRDAIWSSDYDIVFCNSKSGTGKTTIAVATALLACEYGKYSGVIYQVAGGVYENKQGLLPGSIEEKSAPLFAPLVQAVTRLGYDPQKVIVNDGNVFAQKEGSGLITAQTDSYIRGISLGETDSPVIIIIDEYQNCSIDALKTILSRVNVGSKAVCIGCEYQCDLKEKKQSSLKRAEDIYIKYERTKICQLTTCYRSWIAAVADEL